MILLQILTKHKWSRRDLRHQLLLAKEEQHQQKLVQEQQQQQHHVNGGPGWAPAE